MLAPVASATSPYSPTRASCIPAAMPLIIVQIDKVLRLTLGWRAVSGAGLFHRDKPIFIPFVFASGSKSDGHSQAVIASNSIVLRRDAHHFCTTPCDWSHIAIGNPIELTTSAFAFLSNLLNMEFYSRGFCRLMQSFCMLCRFKIFPLYTRSPSNTALA